MLVHEVVGIVDRSGSMHGKEIDTVGGINSAFDEIKKNKGEDEIINISVKLFDHEEVMLLRHININNFEEIKVSQFVPRGSTALRDAIGNSLVYFMERKLKNPNAFETCVIYIATDGFENSSKYYTSERLRNLIKNAKETYNIELLYLGSNQDAILEAGKLGIHHDNAINYCETAETIDNVYRGAGSAANRYRSSQNAAFTSVERQQSINPSSQ